MMSYFQQVLTVTRWEFSRFFKPRNELLGILIMLFTSLVFYYAGKYALSENDPEIKIFLIDDSDTLLLNSLSNRFEIQPIDLEQKDSIILQLSENKQWVVLHNDKHSLSLYAYKLNGDIKKLKNAIDEYHTQKQMQTFGILPQQLAIVLSSAQIDESYIYTNNSTKRVILSYFFAGLMIMAVFLSFAYQFTAITGEKQLKITEQIISAIRPQIWMDGKILGITLTGISSMIIYALLSIIGAIIFFQFSETPVSTVLDYVYLPSVLIYLPFALLGILLWNAILAAIAAIITDPNNSGKSSIMMLPIVFVVASFLVLRNPDSAFSMFLSWFPLTSPSSMPMRWAVTEVDFTHVLGSFIFLVFTFYWVRKLAAKIFRLSILLTGKEPTWAEVYSMMKKEKTE